METPINNKNLFPKIEKNVSTNDVMIKTSNDNFKVFLEFKSAVKIAKSGISEKGSIATNALKRFWKNISCIHQKILK